MKTSYEGCDPKIVESLKRGEHANCRCKLIENSGKFEPDQIRIIAYIYDYENDIGYYLDANGIGYDIAELIESETYVIDAVSMMKGLVERGYWVDDVGEWFKEGFDSMNNDMWQHCGKQKVSFEQWEPWMLEEREVE